MKSLWFSSLFVLFVLVLATACSSVGYSGPTTIPDDERQPEIVLPTQPLEMGTLSDEGFKDAKWGSSVEQVVGRFPAAKRFRGQQTLRLEEQYAGKPALIHFYFAENMLFCVRVLMLPTVPLKSRKPVETFKSIKKLLEEEFGPPADEDKHAASNQYPFEVDSYERFLEGINLQIWSKWDTKKTRVELDLHKFLVQVLFIGKDAVAAIELEKKEI